MILIEHRCNFFAIQTDGQECFLIVVCGYVENEHVNSPKWACKDAGIRIHATTSIGLATLENYSEIY